MRRTTFTAAGLVGLALLTPPGTATAAGETCRGEAATIVGTGPTITGTEGRDVIVTGAATSVASLGGDDVVCVVPEGVNINVLTIDAGTGDDGVDTTGSPATYDVTVALGDGADTFIGGAGDDAVATGPDRSYGDQRDRDVVQTGDGADRVTSDSGSDVVDLGPGDDRLDGFSWTTAPDGLLTGGEGVDTIVLETDDTEPGLDLARGEFATSANAYDTLAKFSSFEAADVTLISGTDLYYTGLPGADRLSVRVMGSTPGQLHVDSLGGDDLVLVDNAFLVNQYAGNYEGADTGHIDLGKGDDNLVLAKSEGDLDLDLGLGRLRVDTRPMRVTGVEDAFLLAPRVRLVGSNAENTLLASGCDLMLSGAGADDRLSVVGGDPWFDTYEYDCTPAARMFGGKGSDHVRGGVGQDRLSGNSGRDTLLGRSGNDVLLGGKGRDLADGGKGRDRCAAETERRCER